MQDFKEFMEEKFNAIYLPPYSLSHLYKETFFSFLDNYNDFLSREDLNRIRNDIQKENTSITTFIEKLSSLVTAYHKEIYPEDFDYSLESRSYEELDEKSQLFLWGYSDIFSNISGITDNKTGKKIIFDFSKIGIFHLSKKNIRKIISDSIGKEVKSWQIDNIETISDLKSLYENNVPKVSNEIEKNQSSASYSKEITKISNQNLSELKQLECPFNPSEQITLENSVNSKNIDRDLKNQEARVEKSGRLSDTDLQFFADNLNPKREFFSDEENRIKQELRDAKNKENETDNQIRSLGSKPWAGKEPEAKSYLLEPIKTCGSIWLVCLVILFVFHCAFWLIKVIFDIPWDTWGWTKTFFWWGLIVIGIVFGVALIAYIIKYSIWNNVHKKALEWDKWNKFYNKQKEDYKQKQSNCSKALDKIQTKRISILEYAIRKNLNLPIKEISENLYSTLRNKYLHLFSLQNKIEKITDSKEKLETSISFADKKLEVFFQWSIPSEAQNNNVLNDFVNSYNKKTRNYREDVVIPYLKDSSVNALIKENNGYSQNLLDADIDEFTEILEWDTSGIFTKHSSSRLEEQVNALEQSYRSAVTTYESYSKVGKKINQILGLSRLVAYKNIYLGVELLNIIRDNSGGGTLSTIDDKVDSISFKKNSSLEIKEFSSSQAFKDILSTGFESILTSIGNGLQDKSTRKFMSQNPKSAAMAVAGMAVFEAGQALVDAWKQRNAKIESLLKKQNQIIKEMENIPGVYLENLATSARALEIAEAIIKTNKGFMSIYQPIAQKVFNQKDINLISMIECQKLVLAIKEYKNISSSKL